jgi:hypothetical protein
VAKTHCFSYPSVEYAAPAKQGGKLDKPLPRVLNDLIPLQKQLEGVAKQIF